MRTRAGSVYGHNQYQDPRKFSPRNLTFHRSAKVFSLESFPLYALKNPCGRLMRNYESTNWGLMIFKMFYYSINDRLWMTWVVIFLCIYGTMCSYTTINHLPSTTDEVTTISLFDIPNSEVLPHIHLHYLLTHIVKPWHCSLHEFYICFSSFWGHAVTSVLQNSFVSSLSDRQP